MLKHPYLAKPNPMGEKNSTINTKSALMEPK